MISMRHLSLLAVIVVMAACSTTEPGNTGQRPSPTNRPPSPTREAFGATDAPPLATTSPSPAAGDPPTGTWRGELEVLDDPAERWPVAIRFDHCKDVGEVCGENEYGHPEAPEHVFCAPLLIYRGTEGDRHVFDEEPAFRPEECLPTTLKIRPVDQATLDIEQYAENDLCCRGTLSQVTAGAPDPTALPAGEPIAGLEGPLSAVDLEGYTTQYAARGADAMWFPTSGRVLRVDAQSGKIVASIEAGDPDATLDVGGATVGLDDPHSLAADDSSVWVAQATDRSVARIDPASGQIAETIPLDVSPYALALDDQTLWVTSFEDDAVVRVDLATGSQVARRTVSSPTGVAVGAGSVWVVEHRSDTLVRIDAETSRVLESITLGEPGEHAACSMCVENVVFAYGAAWTANNVGRSVSRVDPATSEVTVIRLEHRAWAVAAGGGAVWASQFEEGPITDLGIGITRIDPASGGVEQLPLPGTLSVNWGHDALWVVVDGRRSQLVYQYRPAD